jgi:MFS family permease
MNLYREMFTHIKSFSSTFWIVIFASFMNQTGNMAFVFLVLYLNKHLGFSLAQSSFAFAAFGGSMLVTGLLGGSLIDRIGAARILIAALFLNALTLMTMPFIHTYIAIIAMCLVWGMSYGFYRPASQTLVSHLSTPGLHKITFSVYRLSVNLGMSIGPALGGFLAAHSFPAIFFANGTANLIAAIIFLAGLYRSPWLSHRPAQGHKLELSIKWLLRDKALLIFSLGMIPVTMIFFQGESTLAVFLNRDMGLPLSFYGLLFTLNTLMIVFMELSLNVAMMNWPYRINFMLGSFLITAGFAGFIFASQAWHVIMLSTIWTLGEMVLFPSSSSYMADIAPEAHRGSYMSIYITCSNLGLLLGPWLGAIIMEQLGSQGLWIACGLWGLISVAIFRYSPEPE